MFLDFRHAAADLTLRQRYAHKDPRAAWKREDMRKNRIIPRAISRKGENMKTTKCPLCLAKNSPYEIVGKMSDMYFKCDSCKRSFVITEPAYNVLLDYKQDVKEENMKNFDEMPKDHIWYFHVPNIERKEGIMFPAVAADPVLRKNLFQ